MKWLDKLLMGIGEAQYQNSRQGTRIIPITPPTKPPKGSTRDFNCSPPEGSRPPEPKNQYGNKIPELCYEAPENPIKEKENAYMNYKKVIENQIETLEERQKKAGLSVVDQCLVAKTIAEITEIADKIKPGID